MDRIAFGFLTLIILGFMTFVIPGCYLVYLSKNETQSDYNGLVQMKAKSK